jgi:two-component system, OmpR family, sensor histidine kinase BaeS
MESVIVFQGRGMFKSLWLKFLILLIVVSITALSAAFLLRDLMLNDFREYIEGDREDRIDWITAALESSYDRKRGWDETDLSENVIWALMLGFDIKLYDEKERLLIDTAKALEIQSDNVTNRIEALSKTEGRMSDEKPVPYPLFLEGEQIGRMDVFFLRPQKEDVFISRSNDLLLISLVVLGGLAILISIFFSRRLTSPIKGLTLAAEEISGGNLKSRVGIKGRDEIARLSDAFNRMAHSLEVQESLRKKLTANIAHELRTPISAMRGELEAMIDGLLPVDSENLESLHYETGRLKKIIEGIEELAQAEASSRYMNRKVLSARSFMEGIISRLKLLFNEKGVALELFCDDGMEINADPDRLSQIMINLLSNALKATGSGGRVHIKVYREDKVVIEVCDNGKGISKDDVPYIFERFYRAEKGGLGIGLTIVKELVEAHGGTIKAMSADGGGTIFRIEIPD